MQAPRNTFEPLTAELFLAKVTNAAAAPLYEFSEAWEVGGAWAVKAGGRAGGAANPAVAITGLTLAVDDYFLCRSAAGDGGTRWEALARVPGQRELTTAIDFGPASYSISADSTWEDPGIEVTADADGYYLIVAQVSMSGAANSEVQLFARLVADGVPINYGWMRSGVTVARLEVIPLTYVTYLAAGAVVKVQVWRDPATWTQAAVFGDSVSQITRSFVQLTNLTGAVASAGGFTGTVP